MGVAKNWDCLCKELLQMNFTLNIVVVCILWRSHALCLQDKPQKTLSIEDMYTKAIDAYSSEKWLRSVNLLEKTLVHYKMLKTVDINCRTRCENPNATKELRQDFTGFKELEVYGNLLVQANCIKVCQEGHPFSIHGLEYPRRGIRREFDSRKIYNYLQYAYYRTGQIKKACEAAWTFLQKHPEDDEMQKNINFYKQLPDASEDDFVDIEAHKYEKLYFDGASAYDNKDYKTAVAKMEEFFTEYFNSFHECCLLCYQTKAPTHTLRLHQATAARHHQVIECMLQCEETLAPVIGGHVVPKVVPRTFSYLQFSYFYTNQYSKCIAAASSEFLLDPDGENAKNNMKFYKEFVKQKQLNNISFKPRQDAVQYHDLHSTLWQLLEKTTYLQEYEDEGMVEEEEVEEVSSIIDQSELMSAIVDQISQTLSEKLVGEVE